MSNAVKILVGSMSGTAEMAADEVETTLREAGISANVVGLDEIKLSEIQPGAYVICTSTYGVGEVPDNAKALYEALQTERPDLGGVVYGVVGLGDSIYPETFCFGGKRFDKLLGELGAVRLGERVDHDSRSALRPEEVAAEWADGWAKLLIELLDRGG
ncbi:MioC protein [Variovorax sp. YR752]|uniref:flavodoxin domain-containing protein n=1 Tax=unclassified Variovorax TaxID=663243 RepID=UPI000BC50541|nr:flavodoxin domain-containing protein [Variovorax sp. YR752]SOE06310.1 MioC protein [Variovorax sp. YR752]